MRSMRTFLILLAVLVVGLAVADRVAVRAAQDQLASRVIDRGGLSGGSVEVSIHGFPFLTQVIRGRYTDIEVQARGVTLQDVQDLTVSAHLRGVRLSMSDLRASVRPDLPVDSADGYVVVPYDELARRGLELGADEGLRALSLRRAGTAVGVSATITVLGVEVTGSAEAGVSFTDGQPSLAVSAVDLGPLDVPDSVARAAVAVLNLALARAIDLPALPYGLELTSVSATSAGVRINAAATDVVL